MSVLADVLKWLAERDALNGAVGFSRLWARRQVGVADRDRQ